MTYRLDPDATSKKRDSSSYPRRDRIARLLWSSDSPQARTPDALVRRVVAAYLGVSERTIRRAMRRETEP